MTWDTVCSRCGESYTGMHHDHVTNDCIYEPCIEVSCKAKRYPSTPHEVFLAFQHWKHHDRSPGHCAHGRRAE